jgi:hypothetical protein
MLMAGWHVYNATEGRAYGCSIEDHTGRVSANQDSVSELMESEHPRVLLCGFPTGHNAVISVDATVVCRHAFDAHRERRTADTPIIGKDFGREGVESGLREAVDARGS